MGTLNVIKGKTFNMPVLFIDGIDISQTEFKVKYIKYSSYDTSVAKVGKTSSGDLSLTLLNPGTTTIKAETSYTLDYEAQNKYTNGTSIFYLNISEPEPDPTPTSVSVTGVRLSATNKTINKGESFTLRATVLPTNATNQNVVWSSSNPAVVRVSNGVITGINAGTATITVTTVDENKTASAIITVTSPSTPDPDPGTDPNPGTDDKTTVTISVSNQSIYNLSSNYTYTPTFLVTGAPKSAATLSADSNSIIKSISGLTLTLYGGVTGSARVNISIEETSTYKSASASFTLTVNEEDTPSTPTDENVDDLSTIILKFNSKLGSGYVPKSGDVYLYLKTMYDYGSDEFDYSYSNFFSQWTYREATEGSSSEFASLGYRGNNNTFEQDGTSKNAMLYWLMAMCLSELIPSSGNNNNLTKLYKVAYDLGRGDDYGKRIKLYDNYTVKSDLTIARLAASGIYACYHDDEDITLKRQAARNALGSKSNTISGVDFDSLGWSSTSSIGYLINLPEILPHSPGPRTVGHDINILDFISMLSSTGLDSNNNYIVDSNIDQYIVRHYNLYAGNGSTVADDLSAFKSQTSDVQTRVLEAATIPFSYDGVYFRHEKVRLVEVKDSPNGLSGIHRYEFETTNDAVDYNNVFEVAGPFSDDYENIAFRGRWNKNTSVMTWLGRVMDIGDNSRHPFLKMSNGEYEGHCRTRPLGRTDSYKGVTRGQSQRDQLSGLLTGRLARFFDDYDNNYNDDDYPMDSSRSYPSGHAAQSWILALMLGQTKPETLISCMTGAYRFGVNRTIGRYHWNSDVMYGRLCATMIFPIVNAMTLLYEGVKLAISQGGNSSGGSVVGSATFTPCSEGNGGSSGGNTISSDVINVNIHNNSGSDLVVGTISFITTSGDTGGIDSMISQAKSVPNGTVGTFSSVNISEKASRLGETLVRADIYNMSNGNYVLGNNFSSGILNGGQTYDIYLGGNDYSTVSGGGSNSGSLSEGNCNSSTITITNNTGNAISILNNINFVLSNNDRSGRITLNFDNGSTTRSLANGSSCTATFDASSGSGYGVYNFRNMSTSITFNDDLYTTNIVLYDSNGIAMYNTGMQLPSDLKFTNGTYTVNLGSGGNSGGGSSSGGSDPTPISGDNILFSLNLTNASGNSVTLDGDVCFVLSNPTNYGWDGPYNRTDHINFVEGSVTIPNGSSRTVTINPYDFASYLSLSPADRSAVEFGGRLSNILLYIGGNSEIVICDLMDPNIVFLNGATYNVTFR